MRAAVYAFLVVGGGKTARTNLCSQPISCRILMQDNKCSGFLPEPIHYTLTSCGQLVLHAASVSQQ